MTRNLTSAASNDESSSRKLVPLHAHERPALLVSLRNLRGSGPATSRPLFAPHSCSRRRTEGRDPFRERRQVPPVSGKVATRQHQRVFNAPSVDSGSSGRSYRLARGRRQNADDEADDPNASRSVRSRCRTCPPSDRSHGSWRCPRRPCSQASAHRGTASGTSCCSSSRGSTRRGRDTRRRPRTRAVVRSRTDRAPLRMPGSGTRRSRSPARPWVTRAPDSAAESLHHTRQGSR